MPALVLRDTLRLAGSCCTFAFLHGNRICQPGKNRPIDENNRDDHKGGFGLAVEGGMQQCLDRQRDSDCQVDEKQNFFGIDGKTPRGVVFMITPVKILHYFTAPEKTCKPPPWAT